MDQTLPPTPSELPYVQDDGLPRSGSLITAAVLCFLGTVVPLSWLALQLYNLRLHQLHAALTGARLPFGLLLLEDVTCVLTLVALLIVSGVLLCVRVRWAVHVAGAVLAVVLVGATGATLAEAVRRFSDDSPMKKPASHHAAEIALRAATCVVLPLAVVGLLSRRSVWEAVASRRGSMPGLPVLLFAAGTVFIWYGLAATSVHEQALPYGVYFGRFYGGAAVTLWRLGFAAAWVLAGVLLVRGRMTGWAMALIVTLAAIASEALLAAVGGTDVLKRETIPLSQQLAVGLGVARAGEPNAPWLAALWRSATPLCLLALLLLAGRHFLFEDVPDPPETTGLASA
jgi:hypothetical protein